MFIPHLYLAPRRGWRRRNFAKMFDNRKTTPCSKKTKPLDVWHHLLFDKILANVDRFSKFFHQEICKKILYVYIAKFPSNLQYNILQVRWKSLWYVHREFSYESHGERILKICQSYYQTSRGLFFLEHGKMIGQQQQQQSLFANRLEAKSDFLPQGGRNVNFCHPCFLTSLDHKEHI